MMAKAEMIQRVIALIESQNWTNRKLTDSELTIVTLAVLGTLGTIIEQAPAEKDGVVSPTELYVFLRAIRSMRCDIQRPDVPEQVIQEVAEAIEILETHSSERYAWAAINTLMELGWKPKGKGR